MIELKTQAEFNNRRLELRLSLSPQFVVSSSYFLMEALEGIGEFKDRRKIGQDRQDARPPSASEQRLSASKRRRV